MMPPLRERINHLSAPVRAALVKMLSSGLDADQLSHAPDILDWEIAEALAQLETTDEPRPRVVVTGLGALTPVGLTATETWQSLVAGKSGIARVTQFDASAYPCQIGGEIKGFNPQDYGIPVNEARRMARCAQVTLVAGTQAVADAGISWAEDEMPRVGVCIGTGLGGFDLAQEGFKDYWRTGVARVRPYVVTGILPNMPAFYLSQAFHCKGPLTTVVTACAAGTQAIGEATETIRRGAADVMLAGGVEALIGHPFFGGFTALRAISTRNDEPERASRPFDAKRDGFVIGEGVAVFVLERLEHALKRGARIYAEILGQSATADAYHIAAPEPEGAGASRAMASALADAGIKPRDVDYINAHGTATPLGDPAETRAIKQVFGEHAYDVAISSTKSMIGHAFGGAGAIEALACVNAVYTDTIHPTINYEYPDPDCDLDYVPNVARQTPVRVALSNSFGLGGQNACLVVGKYTNKNHNGDQALHADLHQ